ncbi:MAG: 30S ribosomal protein S16 [Saprospiraceae bacterium]|uniref:Small ribosomal subunit protein bS16 n=1 Tax=Candidatus Opimibacter skivensis TaxID=2982028 RepID=A0A9D7SY83_9BACT|nr:30S ribosomal protein S16 [Candidatus Opimibacter skivensis]
MSVRIRLQRHGRKQSPLYHIVIADARSPRDGSFIERIGTYNPMTRPATIDIDRMKAYEWLKNGAQPTDTVNAILRFKGVLFYKHLQRGVAKGSFTAEEAEIKFRGWVDDKESRIEARVKSTAADKKARAAEISGTVKKAEKKKEKEKVEHKADELLNVTLDQPTPQAEEVKSEAPEVVADVPETQTTESTPETPAENTGEAGE